ncbi:MAG TPA: nitroreductase family protein [Candidatus Acidoferrales bacterium]|jgi:nitroreductase|nr:nitroreductase family protein [Candidatus Acidoferrales bacterium]
MTLKKKAETQFPIHEIIGQRWSSRAFSERPVEPEKLISILEAARWAASSANEQPWAFLVATGDNRKNYEAMAGVLVDSNRTWAEKAPVLILVFAHTQFAKNGNPNRYALHDVGQAVANLSLQATALGLTVHQMAGFNAEAARERFAAPADWQPVSVIALGYPGDPESLAEKLREREIAERQRKPLDTFVFSGAWGHTAEIPGFPKLNE